VETTHTLNNNELIENEIESVVNSENLETDFMTEHTVLSESESN